MTSTRSQELADFLRSRRERLSPVGVGLPAEPRRRTAGLRREEVAQLAGIGVDWYVRLEQGRAVAPSPATVEALGRALRLSPAELAHLRALAQAQAPGKRPFALEVVPQSVRRVVESLSAPAYVTGRRWDVLAWNAAANAIFGYADMAEGERNNLIAMLTTPQARRLFGAGWAEEARRMTAQFRASYDLHAGDPEFQQLFGRLRAGCAEFEGWWEAHEVRGAPAGRKRLALAEGVRELDFATFQANDDPALKLVVYTPAV